MNELWIVHCSLEHGECAYSIVCLSEEIAKREQAGEEGRSDGMMACYYQEITLDPETGTYR